jgi:transposase
VARLLEELGHEVVVADPNYAPMYAQRSRRVKTDKRDAQALAEACRLGAYRPAHRTSEEQRHVRALLSVRENLVRSRARFVTLVQAIVNREGFRVATGTSRCFSVRVEDLELPEHLVLEIGPLLTMLGPLNEQIPDLLT